MDFELSPQQEQFRRVIRDFVDRSIRPVAREWEHAGRYPTRSSTRWRRWASSA